MLTTARGIATHMSRSQSRLHVLAFFAFIPTNWDCSKSTVSFANLLSVHFSYVGFTLFSEYTNYPRKLFSTTNSDQTVNNKDYAVCQTTCVNMTVSFGRLSARFSLYQVEFRWFNPWLLTLRLFRAASAPIIVCTAVIKFFISCILWGEIKVLLLFIFLKSGRDISKFC